MLTNRIATLLALLLFINVSVSQAQQTQEIETMIPTFRKTERLAEAIEKGASFQTRVTRNENGLVGVNKKTAIIHPIDEVSAHKSTLPCNLPAPISFQQLLQRSA